MATGSNSMLRLLLFIPLLCCLLGACGPGGDADDTLLSSFRPLSPDGWRYADTLVFPMDRLADSTACTADVALTVRHSNDYPYSNIWLEIATPAGTRSVCMELADVFGRWYGRGMGLSFERTDTVVRGLRLTPADTLRVHHNMRLDTLPGIEQLGIFVIRN